MMAPGTRQRLGVVVAVAVIGCAHAGVARAEESVLAEPFVQEVEAVAESTEVADQGSGKVSQPQPPGQSKKSLTGPSATIEPTGTGVQTTEPTPAVTEPTGTGVQTTEPTPAATEPLGAALEPAAEPIVEAMPSGIEPLQDGLMVLTGSRAPAPSAGVLLAELRGDSSAPGVGVDAAGVPSDKEGRQPASPSVDDSGSPSLPHAPTSAGASGASAASASGASGAFAALVALVALVPLALSRVLGLLLTPLRPPTLVADVHPPG